MYYYIKIILCLSGLLQQINADNYIIQSPKLTNWGNWGPWADCPSGQFVNGMQLKKEAFINGDNTALNGIKLSCRAPGSTASTNTLIQSTEGPFGSWGSVTLCDYLNNAFSTGFQLDSSPDQGPSADDVAANNLLLYCNYGNGILADRLSATPNYIGGFTGEQMCKSGYFLCGIRTQVEGAQGSGDDTSLNNVEMKCCSTTASPTPFICSNLNNYTTLSLIRYPDKTISLGSDNVDARNGAVIYDPLPYTIPQASTASGRKRRQATNQCQDPNAPFYNRVLDALVLISLSLTLYPTPAAVPIGELQHLSIQDAANPVQNVFRRRIGSTAGGQPVFRTEVLTAEIFPRHVGVERTDLTGLYFRTYLGGGIEDQRGHLLGSQFSGPPTAAAELYYNLVPQHQTVNQDQPRARGRNVLTSWVEIERRMRLHFDQNVGAWAQYAVISNYDGLTDGRPTYFWLTVTLRGQNGEIVDEITGGYVNQRPCYSLFPPPKV